MFRTASVLASFAAFAGLALATVGCSSPAVPNLQDSFGGDTTAAAAAASDADAGTSTAATTATTPTTSDADAGTDAMATSGDASTTFTGPTCPYKGPPINVTAYPTCLEGGRCVPPAMVPAAKQSEFATCDTGFCLPEKVVAALGEYLPPTCQAAEGAEGRCLSTVIPSVTAMASTLTQATCDTNELCTPCYNPMDGTDTGACETVSCDMPAQPAKVFADCCTMDNAPQGKCVPTALVSSVANSSVSSELSSCDSSGDVCAPTENLSSTFKPVYCEYDDGFLGFGNYSGFCVSKCVKNNDGLDRGSCDNMHFCAPCQDGDGNPTGVPGCK